MTLRYRGAVKAAGPGIASTDRARFGSFASLLDQILHDATALDGLAFAYAELAAPQRQALVRAVLQDAADPTHALGALLAVEEQPRARRRLAGLISRHGRIEQSALLEGTEAEGEAHLLQSLPRLEPESLHITWNDCKINVIALEPRNVLNFDCSSKAVSIPEAVETLAPLLWQHIRAGGALPEGVERFAGFFSVS